MDEPPTTRSEEANKRLKETLSSGGRFKLSEKERSLFQRYQTDFYWFHSNREKRILAESFAGVLDRISLAIPKALTNALGLTLHGIDANSATKSWLLFDKNIDADLIALHLQPLHDICIEIFNSYHKFSKPLPEEIIQSFSIEKAHKDFLRIGEQFQKVFESDGLFLTLDEYQDQDSGETPINPFHDDEQLSIIERIQRFELYLSEVRGDISDLDSKHIIDVAEAYWHRGNEEQSDWGTCIDLLRLNINHAKEQNFSNDLVDGKKRIADKLQQIGQFIEAEEILSEALSETTVFGKDNRYANTLVDLIACRISGDLSPKLSDAENQINEAIDIWRKYGHNKGLLSAIRTKIRLHIYRSEFDKAENEIQNGLRLYEDEYHPRSHWFFLNEISYYLLECPDEKMNSMGLEILKKAVEHAWNFGEFTSTLSSMQQMCKYTEGVEKTQAITRYERISKDKEKLDQEIMNLTTNIYSTEKLQKFVNRLIGYNYIEGLRIASQKISFEQFAGPEFTHKFEGDYGRFRKLTNQLASLHQQQQHHHQKAHDLQEELHHLATKFNSYYMDTLLIESKQKFYEFTSIESSGFMLDLIERWEYLDSLNGIMRWKLSLAKWNWANLKEHPSNIRQHRMNQSRELVEEVVIFFSDKDMRKFMHAMFEKLKWTRDDESVDSTEEYKALEAHLPNDPKIRCEYYSRASAIYRFEGLLEESIIALGKANEYYLQTSQLDEATTYHRVDSFTREIGYHIVNKDTESAKSRMNDLKKIGKGESEQHVLMLLTGFEGSLASQKGNSPEAKKLYRQAINQGLEIGSQSSNEKPKTDQEIVDSYFISPKRLNKKISLHYHFLYREHIDSDSDEADDILLEKIRFDSNANFHSFVFADIRSLIERTEQKSGIDAVKHLLKELHNDDNIPSYITGLILSQLHYDQKDDDEAERLLKHYISDYCTSEDNLAIRNLKSTITMLKKCCQRNKGNDHVISVFKDLFQQTKNEYPIALALLRILTETHREMEDFEQEEKTLLDTIQLAEENNGNFSLMTAYDNLIDYYIRQKEWESAKETLESTILMKNRHPRSISFDLKKLSDVHINLGEFDDAFRVMKKGVSHNMDSERHQIAWSFTETFFVSCIKHEKWKEAQDVMLVRNEIPYDKYDKYSSNDEIIMPIIRNFESLSQDEIKQKIIELLKQALHEHNIRKEANSQLKKARSSRDQKNSEVADLIRQVQSLKQKRDEANMEVKSLKKERDNLSKELKESRRLLEKGEGSKSSTKDLERKQEKSHNKVTQVADEAQKAHALMTALSEEVARLREASSNHHRDYQKYLQQHSSSHQEYAKLCIIIQAGVSQLVK